MSPARERRVRRGPCTLLPRERGLIVFRGPLAPVRSAGSEIITPGPAVVGTVQRLDEQARCSPRALWHVLRPPRSWRAIRLHRHVWATFYYSRMKAIYPSQAHRLQYTWCQVAMAASHGTTLGGLRTDILGSPPGPRPAHLLPVLQQLQFGCPIKGAYPCFLPPLTKPPSANEHRSRTTPHPTLNFASSYRSSR